MPRYIDADEADKIIETQLGVYDTTDLKEMLRYFPTADAAPVRHGKWVYERTIPTIGKIYRCNNCNRLVYVKDERLSNIKDYPYCHCGAKMDLE